MGFIMLKHLASNVISKHFSINQTGGLADLIVSILASRYINDCLEAMKSSVTKNTVPSKECLPLPVIILMKELL